MWRDRHIDDAVSFQRARLRAPHTEGDDPSILFISPFTQIENKGALSAQLNLPIDCTLSDFLLGAWDQLGPRLPESLEGAFAFMIYAPSSGQLFLARDIFGVSPLYYHLTPNDISLASTSRSLRRRVEAREGERLTINSQMVSDFICGQFLETQQTFFKGLSRLPPATTLQVFAEETKESTYWSAHQIPKNQARTKVVKTFQKELDAAVSKNFVQNKTHVMVSGGLDSSALIGSAAAQKLQSEQLRGICMSYHSTVNWADGAHIESVRRTLNIDLHEIPSDTHNPLYGLRRWLCVMDGPYLAYGHSVTANMWDQTREMGFTHMLSGHGGDEVVSYGFGRLNELAMSRKWWRLWQNVGAASDLYGGSKLQQFRKYLSHISLHRKIEHRISSWRSRMKTQARENRDPTSYLSDELQKRVPAGRYGALTADQRGYHTERDIQEEVLSSALQPLSLEIFTLCSHAAGIKTVTPFYSKRLVEYSLSLKSCWKLRNGYSRYILREAMTGRIPDSVRLRRDKYDFTENFRRGILSEPDQLLKLTHPNVVGSDKYVNLQHLEDLRARVSKGDDNIAMPDIFFLWRAAVLGIWLADLKQESASDPIDNALTQASPKLSRKKQMI